MSTPDPDITSRLTASVARIAEAMTATEIDLLRRYQALDRTYEIVAGVERGRIQLEELDAEQADLVAAIIETLDDVSMRWRTPKPLVLFRGQRSRLRVLGDQPALGRTIEAETHLSTTLNRQVALDEFTTPPGPGGPVLFELVAPEGTRGLWLPPVGDPTLAYQQELLLPRDTRIAVRGERKDSGIIVLECEVLP